MPLAGPSRVQPLDDEAVEQELLPEAVLDEKFFSALVAAAKAFSPVSAGPAGVQYLRGIWFRSRQSWNAGNLEDQLTNYEKEKSKEPKWVGHGEVSTAEIAATWKHGLVFNERVFLAATMEEVDIDGQHHFTTTPPQVRKGLLGYSIDSLEELLKDMRLTISPSVVMTLPPDDAVDLSVSPKIVTSVKLPNPFISSPTKTRKKKKKTFKPLPPLTIPLPLSFTNATPPATAAWTGTSTSTGTNSAAPVAAARFPNMAAVTPQTAHNPGVFALPSPYLPSNAGSPSAVTPVLERSAIRPPPPVQLLPMPMPVAPPPPPYPSPHAVAFSPHPFGYPTYSPTATHVFSYPTTPVMYTPPPGATISYAVVPPGSYLQPMVTYSPGGGQMVTTPFSPTASFPSAFGPNQSPSYNQSQRRRREGSEMPQQPSPTLTELIDDLEDTIDMDMAKMSPFRSAFEPRLRPRKEIEKDTLSSSRAAPSQTIPKNRSASARMFKSESESAVPQPRNSTKGSKGRV